MDAIDEAKLLFGLVEFECDADLRTVAHTHFPDHWSAPVDAVVGWYAGAMDLLTQHARTELARLDEVGL